MWGGLVTIVSAYLMTIVLSNPPYQRTLGVLVQFRQTSDRERDGEMAAITALALLVGTATAVPQRHLGSVDAEDAMEARFAMLERKVEKQQYKLERVIDSRPRTPTFTCKRKIQQNATKQRTERYAGRWHGGGAWWRRGIGEGDGARGRGGARDERGGDGGGRVAWP